MLGSVITAVGIVGVLTFMLATLLIVAARKLHVEEDPRIATVEGMLPHNNCGACGFPSCHLFAEALVGHQTLPGKCSVGSDEDKDKIARFLQVDKGQVVKHVARLACAGGTHVASIQAEYRGLQTCSAATQVAGGGKTCMWGCLGFADCAKACTFDAIHMNEHGLPEVDEQTCTACGDCVVACPKDLFSIQSVQSHLWVRCRNQEQGDHILAHCQVACTACGRCAQDAADNVIVMQNNLPLIRYDIAAKTAASKHAIDRCPTGAIVWYDETGHACMGSNTKPITRHTPLSLEES